MNAKLKYFSLFFIGVFATKAQLLVSTNNNAATLVNQIVGNNVTITNPVLICNQDASGLFISNGSNVGLPSGIILSTGKAVGAMGPNSQKDYSDCFISNTSFADPNILALEPEAKYDGCILEFDIIPICNTLQIRYVFGSEEYPEYVDSKFNDVFGFFVTGPNPGGGNYNGYNIARLPNGTPVSINTINNGTANFGPCKNCLYYVDNFGGSTVQYDGLTVPLTASVNVVPCSTYHLKLAIADAGDCRYDSGVLLEYQGISCANSQIPIIAGSATTSVCDLNNGVAQANVSNYNGPISYNWSPGGQTTAAATNLSPGTYVCTIGFQLPCPYTKTLSVVVPHNPGFSVSNAITNVKCPQDITGSATVTPLGGTGPYNYVWNTIPPQSVNTATALGFGKYVCTITDALGCSRKDTVDIYATTTLTLNPTSIKAICTQTNGSAFANANGGVGPYTYSWNTVPVQTTSSASGLLPAVYSVSVTDTDGCTRSAFVTVSDSFPIISVSDSIIQATCNHGNGSILLTGIKGGTSPYSYSWSNGETLPDNVGIPAGTYTLNVKDANTCPASFIFNVNNFNYLPILQSQKDDKCDQKKGWANALVIGGTGPFNYNWSPASIGSQTTATATKIGQGVYTVTVTDALGCIGSSVFTIINENDPFYGTAQITPHEAQAGENFNVVLHPGGIWTLSSGRTKDGALILDTTVTLNYPEFGDYYINYSLISINGCKTTFKYDFFIKDYMTLYFPNTFTPNDDRVNDVYYAIGTLVKEFKMSIYDRWGERVFITDDLYKGWDGKIKNGHATEDVYTYRASAVDYFGKRWDYTGNINLIR